MQMSSVAISPPIHLMRNCVHCCENKGHFYINYCQPFYLIDFSSSLWGFIGFSIMNKRTKLLSLIFKLQQ